MNDDPKDKSESPIARALRLKTAALAAKGRAPGGDKHPRRPAAGMPQGASKPAPRK